MRPCVAAPRVARDLPRAHPLRCSSARARCSPSSRQGYTERLRRPCLLSPALAIARRRRGRGARLPPPLRSRSARPSPPFAASLLAALLRFAPLTCARALRPARARGRLDFSRRRSFSPARSTPTHHCPRRRSGDTAATSARAISDEMY